MGILENSVWTHSIRPRLVGFRDYANNIWVEAILNGFGFVSGVLLGKQWSWPVPVGGNWLRHCSAFRDSYCN